MSETYQQMKARHRRESDARTEGPGIFVAFSEGQYRDGLAAYKAAGFEESDITSAGMGFFGDRGEICGWLDLLESQGAEVEAAMADGEFAVGAYYHEMCDHEYGINMDGDWDVLRCFGHEDLSELDGEQRRFYLEARRRYYEEAERGGWL